MITLVVTTSKSIKGHVGCLLRFPRAAITFHYISLACTQSHNRTSYEGSWKMQFLSYMARLDIGEDSSQYKRQRVFFHDELAVVKKQSSVFFQQVIKLYLNITKQLFYFSKFKPTSSLNCHLPLTLDQGQEKRQSHLAAETSQKFCFHLVWIHIDDKIFTRYVIMKERDV